MLKKLALKPLFDPRVWVTPEHLNVAPALLGLPLATPRKRLFAMGVDLGLILLISNLGNAWMLLSGSLALWLYLRRRKPGRRLFAWAFVIFMFGLGLQEVWSDLHASRQGPRPAAEAASAASTDSTDSTDSAASAASVASTASAASAAVVKVEDLEEDKERRIATLEKALKKAQAKQAAPFNLRAELKHWLDDFGLSYFWALVYFSLLPTLWPGQTPGKRLLGLRVVELTGKPLTPIICFKRYGGYAAGMATGGLGFAQLIWDDNRQAIQDKTAHTVVLDLRNPARQGDHPDGPDGAGAAASKLTELAADAAAVLPIDQAPVRQEAQ